MNRALFTDSRFGKGLHVVAVALAVAAGALLIALLLLTVADVVSRNLLGRSILGVVDISTMLLVAVAFLGLAAAEIDGRHVSVTLIEARLPKRVRATLAIVRVVLLAGIGIILLVGLSEVLGSSISRGETTNDILRLDTWPAKLVLLISFALFFVTAIVNQVRELLAGMPVTALTPESEDLA
ncbi:TRAP transporter small permease subunit [Pseudoclavibacter terrae]|uniref:TRAP transporter small permease subunit n=1 Tax=Pseudoclavibacter terrae TaxID=1530195 RepID=UPI00232D354D|nr:TRAP transporter small permease [Pseudoclavibacter terrae]